MKVSKGDWGVWMRIIALMCAVSFVLLAILSCAGCGEEDKGAEQDAEQEMEQGEEDEEDGKDEADEEAGDDSEDDADDEEDGDDAEDDDASTSGGNTDFILDGQEIGTGEYIPELRVSDIRWSNHGEYFRIVFEFENSDGSEVTEVPNCRTWYPGGPGSERYYEIYISLSDIVTYKFDYAPFATPDTPVSLGDSLVETMERYSTADGESVFFIVRCSHSEAHPGVSSRPHRLMYESDPMRVILNIQNMGAE
jgi:hypothetical protein